MGRAETKYEQVARRLMAHWGFRMYRNDIAARGRRSSECKTGYTVTVTIRGTRWVRYRSLAEIERAWLKDAPQ